VPEFGFPGIDPGTAARRIGSALGLTFQGAGSRGDGGPWHCWEGQGSRVLIHSNGELREAWGDDLDGMDYYEAQSLRFPVSAWADGDQAFLIRLTTAVLALFQGATLISHRPLEDLGAQLAAMAGAASVSFRGVRGQLGRLLRHPALRALRRVEVHEQFDLDPSDIDALRACQDWSPIAVVGVGDGPGSSGEEVIRLLATLPAAWRVERLVLNWDSYLEGSPAVRKREAEVDQAIGRSICRVNPSS
jgi:hypothetical protein